MSEKLISSRAKWNLQEIIPVIIVLGLGLLALYAYISELWPSELAIIGMIVGFGLVVYLFGLNFNRKRKSTLFADLKNDDKFGISIWMRKPLKHKWNGKLDKGNNEASLANTRFVVMDSIMSTRVMVFNTGKGKNLYVPVRLVTENEEARLYLIEAVEALGNQLKFKNKEDKSEFEQILLGEGNAYKKVDNATEFDAQGNQTLKHSEPSLALGGEVVPDIKEAQADDEEVKKEEEPASFGYEQDPSLVSPINVTRAIGYDKYEKKTVSGQIDEVIGDLNKRLDKEAQEKEEKLMPLHNDLFGNGSNSIVIELPQEDNKK